MKQSWQVIFIFLCAALMLVGALILNYMSSSALEVHSQMVDKVKQARQAEQRWKEIAHERHAEVVECHIQRDELVVYLKQCANLLNDVSEF